MQMVGKDTRWPVLGPGSKLNLMSDLNQSGKRTVLWGLLRGHFLYFWSYPEEVEQSKVGPACDVQYDDFTTITDVTRTLVHCPR